MGTQQPLTGQAGEHDAVWSLLTRAFLQVNKTAEGSADDFTCLQLRKHWRAIDTYSDPALVFHFQVKTTNKGNRSFHIGRPTFATWLRICEYQPVILVFIELGQVGRATYFFLTLHDWLRSVRGQCALASRATSDITFSLNKDGFVKIKLDGSNFHTKMLTEADRATAALSSPWATLRDYGLYPFDEATLLQYMELASFAETPLLLSRTFAELGSTARFVLADALTGRTDNDLIKQWVAEIHRLGNQESATSLQRKQFALFAKALVNPDKMFHFPVFRVEEVSCWRSFVAMYPHALKFLRYSVRYSTSENDIMFASALLPMLAISNHRAVSAEAWDTIRELQQRRSDFASYRFQRELYRGPAEAGDTSSLGKGVDFVSRNFSGLHEQCFLNNYGWRSEAVGKHLTRKLSSPTVRDQNLRAWYEAMADLLDPESRSPTTSVSPVGG